MTILRRFAPYILLIVLSFFAFKPILITGFFPMHDDTQVTRVFEMTNALKDGMFPVRWSSNLGFGFGYPIFNFYAPFAYYVGAIFNLIVSDSLTATKLMMIVGIVLSGISMFVLAKEFFGIKGGILSALLYLYAPYHALNIYVRGDVAEFYAYGFIPFAIWALYKIYKENLLRYVLISSISFSLIIVSHNLTALMVAPFFVLFALILAFKDRRKIFPLAISFILALMLSAFYFIPAIFEMNYTNVLSQIGGGADFRDHFVCLSQLWTSQWGYGGSAKGCIDGLSFMVGKTHIILSLVAFAILSFTFFRKFKLSGKEKENIHFILLFFVFSLFSVFLMLDISKTFWEILKPMEFFQYPWRFLTILTFTLSFISGGVIWAIGKFLKGYDLWIVSLIIILLALVFNLKFFVPQTVTDKTLKDYTATEKVNWDISKISSEYMPKSFQKPRQKTEIANILSIQNPSLQVLSQNKKTNVLDIELEAGREQEVVVPLAYFPGWKAEINGKNIALKEHKRGSLITLKKGKSKVHFYYASTNLEQISNLITLAGLLSLIIGIIYSRKRYGKI